MAWKKVSEPMSQLLDEALSGYQCEKLQMFGCPAYFINNNMFAGAHQDSIILKLSDEDRKEIMAQNDEIRLFEPFEGRPMREYVGIPESFAGDKREFGRWIERSYEWVASLPPKLKKQKTKR